MFQARLDAASPAPYPSFSLLFSGTDPVSISFAKNPAPSIRIYEAAPAMPLSGAMAGR
jgi:hypothetical protein